MKMHDYSKLLTEIDNLNAEEQKIKDEQFANAQEHLQELETKLINSGMLRDWKQLSEACDKLGVDKRLSYEERQNICTDPLHDLFVTSTFQKIFYREEYKYLLICTIYNEFCTQVKISIPQTMPKDLEVEIKINTINAFIEAYPKYKELKLAQINKEMIERNAEIEKHKMQAKECCNDGVETQSAKNEKAETEAVAATEIETETKPEQIVAVDTATETKAKQDEEVPAKTTNVKAQKKKDKWWEIPILILLIAVFGLPAICVFIMDPFFGREHGATIMCVWGALWLIATHGNFLFCTIGCVILFGLAFVSWLIADTNAINDKIKRDGSVWN